MKELTHSLKAQPWWSQESYQGSCSYHHALSSPSKMESCIFQLPLPSHRGMRRARGWEILVECMSEEATQEEPGKPEVRRQKCQLREQWLMGWAG